MDRKTALLCLFALVAIYFTAKATAKVVLPPADVLHKKDVGFYECCSEKMGSELPDATIRGLCNYTALVGYQQSPPLAKQLNTTQQLHVLWKCLGDGKDHTECCKQEPQLNNLGCLITCDYSLPKKPAQQCPSALEDAINQCVLDGSYNDN